MTDIDSATIAGRAADPLTTRSTILGLSLASLLALVASTTEGAAQCVPAEFGGWSTDCSYATSAQLLDIPFTGANDLLALDYDGRDQFFLSFMIPWTRYQEFYTDTPGRRLKYGGEFFVTDQPYGANFRVTAAAVNGKSLPVASCPSNSLIHHVTLCFAQSDAAVLRQGLNAGDGLAVEWAAEGSRGTAFFGAEGFQAAVDVLR